MPKQPDLTKEEIDATCERNHMREEEIWTYMRGLLILCVGHETRSRSREETGSPFKAALAKAVLRYGTDLDMQPERAELLYFKLNKKFAGD